MKMRRTKSSAAGAHNPGKGDKLHSASSLSPDQQSTDSPGQTSQSDWTGGSGAEGEGKPMEEGTEDAAKQSSMSGSTSSVQDMLAELYRLVKDTHQCKNKSDSNLSNISKIQERVQQEQKISSYYRAKLRSLYQTALTDAETEAECLRKSLDKINAIKTLRNEQRLQARNAGHYSDTDGPRKIMRRGVLMNMLQQTAMTLPLWIGRTENEKPPHLCGSVPAESSYVCKPGDYVAARVRGSDGDENWILAEVISFNSSTNKYEVDDIDEEGKERHLLSRRRIVPLPLMKVNPESNPDALFKKGTLVMALYPQTTCFYRALVERPPEGPIDDYSVLFEDNSYADGYSPALSVAQRYVVQVKEPRKR
ncbi:SAGA-associated factor 29-like [Diadema setosum]|uniref:SAGA-associated factor 29-like n=1 Tax=Diadema setosum TaxID=31175 RepID=UPI003B3B29D3